MIDPLFPEMQGFEPGTAIDTYRIVRRIGQGGMGSVYLARDMRLGRQVAMKVIRQEMLGGTDARNRFLREALLTAQLNHPNIVTVYGAGEHEGCPYVVLEYLPGQTLKERLAEERPGLRQAMRFGLQIAEAVSEAHRQEILHRDLKPDNVIIPADGRLRVVDFGLARLAKEVDGVTLEKSGAPPYADTVEDLKSTMTFQDKTPESPDRESMDNALFETSGGGLRGTAAYMAPEQWQEEPGTRATDIWALGMILHELVAGMHPLDLSSFHGICLQTCSSDPVPSVAENTPGLLPELVELVDSCVQKDPGKRPSAQGVADTLRELLGEGVRASRESPFMGLLPFTERQASLFFGRDAEIAAFIERMREDPILTITGPSGSGKSSFVQAGIIPTLKDHRPWQVIRLRPGTRPFESLASRILEANRDSGNSGRGTDAQATLPSGDNALNAAQVKLRREQETALAGELFETPGKLGLYLTDLARGQKLLLFVDQLEELFTLLPPDTEGSIRRKRFLEALATAADDPDGPIRVVMTLRDDFLGKVAEGDAATRVFERVMVLRPPGPKALEEILERPVSFSGFRYEDPELPGKMAEEVSGSPVALPLLQFAATRLWEMRDARNHVITRDSYLSIGGVAGALARHADSVLAGLTSEEEEIARRIFLRLVTASGTRQVLERRRLLQELGEKAEPVLERLTRERVLLTRKGRDGAELEIIHESLIHAWNRLSRWLDESQEERCFLEQVQKAASLWDERGRPDSETWEKEALAEAERRARHCDAMPRLSSEFLRAGRTRETSRLGRRRVAYISSLVFSIIFIAGLIAGLFLVMQKEREAVTQRQEALRQRSSALAQRQAARLRQGEAELAGSQAALATGDLLQARARLRLGLELGDSRLARAILSQLDKNPLQWKKDFGAVTYAVAFSPDGSGIAVAAQDHGVYLIHPHTGETTLLRGHRDQVFSVAFCPKGGRLASGSADGEVLVWDIGDRTSKSVGRHEAGVWSLAFTPCGKTLASASADKTIRIWDPEIGREKTRLTGHDGRLRALALSPDGKTLASGGSDRVIRIWDLETSLQKAELTGHEAGVSTLAFMPGGRILASGGFDGTARLWDWLNAKPAGLFRIPEGIVVSVAFCPDENTLALGVSDGTIRLWDVKATGVKAQLAGHDARVFGVGCSPDGKTLASVGLDKTMKIWSINSMSESTAARGHEAAVYGIAFTPDGKTLASVSDDKTLRLWNIQTGRELTVVQAHDSGIFGLAISPDGKMIATGGNDKTIRLWSHAGTGSPITRKSVLYGHDDSVWSLAFSPEGTSLASGSLDSAIRLWDLGTGAFRVFSGHRGGLSEVVFSGDGKTLASGGSDRTVRLWNVARGTESSLLSGHEGRINGIAFLTPDRLLSAAEDMTVRFWDIPGNTSRIAGRHKGRIYSLHVSPDGNTFATADSGGMVRIWNTTTLEYREFKGHLSEINMIRFSPDGRLIATSGDDGTVRIREAGTGRPVWRAPLLRERHPVLFSHRGMVDLSSGKTLPNKNSRWADAVLEEALSASGKNDLLCLVTWPHGLEIRNTATDELMYSEKVPGLQHVLALPDACISFSIPDGGSSRKGIVRRHDRGGASRILSGEATTFNLAHQSGDILIAEQNQIRILSPEGTSREIIPSGLSPTAVAKAGNMIATGFRDGNVELVPLSGSRPAASFSFERVPSCPVTRIVPGPEGTLILGFANGQVGLWSMENGQKLQAEKLHGPVIHIQLQEKHLYVATELGDHLSWNLELFYLPACEILHRIWEEIRIVWENGIPVMQSPDPTHPCMSPEKVQNF